MNHIPRGIYIKEFKREVMQLVTKQKMTTVQIILPLSTKETNTLPVIRLASPLHQSRASLALQGLLLPLACL